MEDRQEVEVYRAIVVFTLFTLMMVIDEFQVIVDFTLFILMMMIVELTMIG
jgi:hypothetical protein